MWHELQIHTVLHYFWELQNVSLHAHTAAIRWDPPSFLDCADDDGETVEDEYSSLWSTSVSFILLFIASFLYSLMLSLVKVKQTNRGFIILKASNDALNKVQSQIHQHCENVKLGREHFSELT